LARNSTDWHRLLEICALTDALILDEGGIYDPAHFNDRLLLGLKGTMSDTPWCCQTHRQSPSFRPSQAHQQARALCSASITRPQRSYDPLRRPGWPPSFQRRSETPPHQSWTSPN